MRSWFSFTVDYFSNPGCNIFAYSFVVDGRPVSEVAWHFSGKSLMLNADIIFAQDLEIMCSWSHNKAFCYFIYFHFMSLIYGFTVKELCLLWIKQKPHPGGA